jgi:hypothetical protein
MQLDQRGNILHTVDIDALRGQVAAGSDGSCAVFYDRAPRLKGDYFLTVFDRAFTRKWTVRVPQSTASGSEFHLVPLADGYLAQINNVLVEFDWTGKELWSDVEARGTVKTMATPAQDGFFLVTQDLDMNHGFHVKRATATKKQTRLCRRPRVHRPLNLVCLRLGRNSKIVRGLQVQPEFGRCIEVASQPQGRIGGNAASTVHDLRHACCGNAKFQRKPIYAHSERLQIVSPDRLAGMRERNLTCLLFLTTSLL